MQRIVIVGAGFSGVSLACQLLRSLPDGSVLTLLNASGQMGRGLAYGTRSELHLLNVPAARMGALPDDERGFATWLRGRGFANVDNSFVPRHWYGSYLADALMQFSKLRPGIAFTQRIARVTALQREIHHGFKIISTDRADLMADRVVLALGHFAPSATHACLNKLCITQFVNDPWQPAALDELPVDAPLLLIGTGLTMLDVLQTLLLRGHRGEVLALSRHGLLPAAHRDNELPPLAWQPPPEWPHPSAAPRHLLRALRRAADELQRAGRDWRDLWVGLRPITPALWAALDVGQRAQFLRHLRAYWDVHRHRAAPQAMQTLDEAIARGQLSVRAGRLLDAQDAGDHVRVSWRPRHGDVAQEFRAARIVNCSGPSSRITPQSSPLLWSLKMQGALSECPLGLGVHVDDAHQLLDAKGRAVPGLHYVGPLLKAQFWEATAVPELREHAASVARACVRPTS